MAASCIYGDTDILVPCTTMCAHQGCIGWGIREQQRKRCVSAWLQVPHTVRCQTRDHPWRQIRPWFAYMFLLQVALLRSVASAAGIPIGARHSGWATGFPCSKELDFICVYCCACFKPQEQHNGMMATGRLLVLATRYAPHLVYTCTLGLHLGHTVSIIFND